MTEAQGTEIIRLLRVIAVLTVQAPLCVMALKEGSTGEEIVKILQETVAGIDGKLAP